MIVNTGCGYYVEKATGNIIAKAELPPGDYILDPRYEYFEVINKAALDAIEVWQDPAVIDKSQKEFLISDWLRKTAIGALITEGKLPPEYE